MFLMNISIGMSAYVLPISQSLSYIIFLLILFPYKQKSFSSYFNQNVKPFSYLLLVILAAAFVIVSFPFLMRLPVVINHASAFKGMDVISSLVYGIFIVPILEEMIFRGTLLNDFLKCYTPAKAIVIGSIIFSLIHINPAQMITAFILGLLAGWLYYKTNNLLPGIITHAVINAIGKVTFEYLSPNSYYFYNHKIIYWVFYFICLVILIFSIFLLLKKLNQENMKLHKG